MADPYSDLAKASADMQKLIADAMEARCNDPMQIAMRRQYLGSLDLPDDARAVEFGSGTGHVTRDLLDVAGAAEAIGIEPSPEMVVRARERHGEIAGLSFVEGNAAHTPVDDASVDLVVMHTLLCHVTDPAAMITEAWRILRDGGVLAVLDGDYELSSVALSAHDPLQCLVSRLIDENIRDRWLPRKLGLLLSEGGFQTTDTQSFGYSAAADPTYFLTVVDRGADILVADGVLGEAAASALKAEARRRLEEKTFFGSMSYVCTISRKQ